MSGPTYLDLAPAGYVGPSMARPGNVGGPAARGDGAVVEHLCPECGGDYAENHGALIIVQTCRHCGGRGRMTDDELSAYLAREHRGA